MPKIKLILSAIIFLFIIQTGHSQIDTSAVNKLVWEAIELMDSGQIEESIRLLKDAKKLDPKNYSIDYEIAYANYLRKNYSESITILENVLKEDKSQDIFYQLLGNSYSLNQQKYKAISTYESGLKIFPKSGKLYLERGNVELMSNNPELALTFYEMGIQVEPDYPSNYFRAALIFLNSKNEVWGMIYGEIFMNIERNTKRTKEMSRKLFETYQKEIKIVNDTAYTVSFSNENFIDLNNIENLKNSKLFFGTGVYEITLLLSVLGEKKINLNSLNKIRTKFIEIYYDKKYNEKFPNLLFDYQKKMISINQFEAYNYWLLSIGNEDEFEIWLKENEEKFDNFVDWFNENQLIVNNSNKFLRKNY